MNLIEWKCSHYEYDAKKIKQAYGGQPIDKLLGPGEHMGGMTHGVGWGARNYHPGKGAGENTDYGDGNLFFLEYLAGGGWSRRPFSVEHYVNTHWKKQYEGWHNGQCRGCKAWLDTMVRFVVVLQVTKVTLDFRRSANAPRCGAGRRTPLRRGARFITGEYRTGEAAPRLHRLQPPRALPRQCGASRQRCLLRIRSKESRRRGRASLSPCADAGRCSPTWSAASPSARPAA